MQFETAANIAKQVSEKKISAIKVTQYFLDKISEVNPKLNAYTTILNQKALTQAKAIDQKILNGEPIGALAGVPFAVKNLFDIEGVTTLAGSKINKENQVAKRHAVLIERMQKSDAILLGALSMGEYAYDFTGENCHYGNCANPWSLDSMSGGSSSGSGSATSGGLAPISLGSDTNGSIRVPASLCGIFGLKPTYGRLPRTGSFPFCDSLDHLGPLARSVEDLALSFDAMQGYDEGDHACQKTPTLPTLSSLNTGISDLTIKRAGGYFDCAEFPQALAALNKVCDALSVTETVPIHGAHEARASAYLITNIESSALHKTRLQTRPQDFDIDTRDRFLAGTMLPADWYIRAQQTRRWAHDQMLTLFDHCDIFLAATTPVTAPKMGEKIITIRGQQQPLRPNLGYFTQPISAVGFPSVVVPTQDEITGMPIGIQIVAAPWREDLCLRVAAHLEKNGFSCKQPSL